MVAVRRPTTPATPPPPPDEREDDQEDAVPLCDPEEPPRATAVKSDRQKASNDGRGWALETGKQFWDATVGTTLDVAANLQSKAKGLSGKVSVAHAIQMAARM